MCTRTEVITRGKKIDEKIEITFQKGTKQYLLPQMDIKFCNSSIQYT